MGTIHTIALDRELGGSLRGRIVPEARPLTDWPTTPPEAASVAVTAAAKEIADALRRGPGHAVVDTGLAALDDVELTSAVWNLFTVLCAPVPQYRSGELIFPVEVAAAPVGTPGISHYSMSSAAGGFHTDGTLLDEPPPVAALLCLSPADEGGETLLIDGWRLVAELEPGQRAVLSKPHWFHSGDPATAARSQPVVTDHDGRLELRYLRRYIDEGYRQAGESMPADLTAALDGLDRRSEREDQQAAAALRRGEILLWDNARFIHGRRPFTERSGRRRLRRMYGSYRDTV